jgi:hypothetical protein
MLHFSAKLITNSGANNLYPQNKGRVELKAQLPFYGHKFCYVYISAQNILKCLFICGSEMSILDFFWY